MRVDKRILPTLGFVITSFAFFVQCRTAILASELHRTKPASRSANIDQPSSNRQVEPAFTLRLKNKCPILTRTLLGFENDHFSDSGFILKNESLTMDSLSEVMQIYVASKRIAGIFRGCTFGKGVIHELLSSQRFSEVWFTRCVLSDENLREFGEGSDISSLGVTDCRSKITDQNLDLSKFVNLSCLSLDFSDVTGDSLKQLPNPALMCKLSMSHTELSNESLAVLKRFLNLEELNIEAWKPNKTIAPDRFLTLGVFPSLRNLIIDLDYCNKDINAWYRVFAQQPKLGLVCPVVRGICILSCPFLQDDGLAWINRDFPEVNEVNLRQCPKVTLKGLNCLRHFPNMKNLLLGGCSFSGEGFDKIDWMANKIELLDVSSNPITLGGLQAIGKMRKLKVLNLLDALPNGASLATIRDLPLEDLFVKGNSLSREDFEVLANMPALTRLAWSGDKNGMINDQLQGLLKCKQLKVLDVSGSKGWKSGEGIGLIQSLPHLMEFKTLRTDLDRKEICIIEKMLEGRMRKIEKGAVK
jgi:hypothetical protein